VFVSRLKIERELNVKETKQPIVNQQCVVYMLFNVTCVMRVFRKLAKANTRADWLKTVFLFNK